MYPFTEVHNLQKYTYKYSQMEGGILVKHFHKFKYRPWFQTFRKMASQLIIPFTIFQLLRTLFLPTVFDVLLLTVFIVIAASIYLEVI
jgi:hypothetical protein